MIFNVITLLLINADVFAHATNYTDRTPWYLHGAKFLNEQRKRLLETHRGPQNLRQSPASFQLQVPLQNPQHAPPHNPQQHGPAQNPQMDGTRNGCPAENSPEIESSTGETKRCFYDQDCGSGFACQYSYKLQLSLCCQSTKSPPLATDYQIVSHQTLNSAPTYLIHWTSEHTKEAVDQFNHAPSGDRRYAPTKHVGSAACLDWLPNCRDIARNGKCTTEGNLNWISCCKSCSEVDELQPKLCEDQVHDCHDLISQDPEFCTSPRWSFFAAANCYKSCYC